MSNFDLDGDGKLQEDEVRYAERRLNTQRRIAIAAFVAILCMGFGIPLAAGFDLLSGALIESFSTYLGWFFTILGGIVLGYMGLEAASLLSKK